jgi:Transposase, Mutator family
VTQVFDAPSKAEAKKRVEALAIGLGKQVPEAIACLEAGFVAATQFYAFPREHWHRIRSTNGPEPLHGEIKRRTRAVGAVPAPPQELSSERPRACPRLDIEGPSDRQQLAHDGAKPRGTKLRKDDREY